MALAETAKLVASLELKDKFSPAASKAMQSLGKLESRAFRAGQQIGKGFKNAAHNLRNIGIVAAAGIAFEVKQGLSSLAELETATTSVTGAIQTMGQAGQVSAGQVATWANEIETSVQAAFDDKAITAAASTLIRFGKVVPSNLRQSLVVMTDLAAKTGSVESASSLLAKALADPTKAAGKLARVGVILTKAQQKQIKAFEKAGKKAQAQKVLLEALAQTTQGAAAASVGEYGDALNLLEDATEDAQRALAVGFLPVVRKVADILTKELAKPSTIAAIRSFGDSLASGLDSLVGIAQRLPWQTIGNSLRIAGEGAKTVLGAFTSLPDWVQTAVITGWGLNKLTGGVLGSVFTGLASGLIKGVLGMTAGVVNINAGVVNGPGGIPGGKGLPISPGVVAGGAALGVGAGVAIVGLTAASIAGIGLAIDSQIDPHDLLKLEGRAKTATARGISDENNKPLQELRAIQQALDRNKSTSTTQGEKTRSAFNEQAEKQKAAIAAAANKSTTDAERIKGQVQTGSGQVAGAMTSAASRIVAAVNGLDLSVDVTTVNRTTNKQTFYGPTQGSRNVGKNSSVREFG